jgi:hypothetical protein
VSAANIVFMSMSRISAVQKKIVSQEIDCRSSLDTRVTRLGEFSPFGSLFTLGSFEKLTELAPIIGLLF